MLRSRKKGQSSIEYAILVIVIIGVFVAMNMYIKRGLQGRWKSAVDNLGDQYDPREADTSLRHVLMSNTATQIVSMNAAGGMYTSRTDLSNSVERRTGYIGVTGY
jgi:uncharacterized protein (UPF0333 family)